MSDRPDLNDRVEIIELIDAIFDAVDAKDWEEVESLFVSDDTVHVDFTSVRGGTPSIIPAAEFVDRWRQALHPRKKSFHMVSHYRVTTDGDTGKVVTKAYAYNILDPVLGGEMWEVWGSFVVPARRTPEGWKATGVSVFAWHSRGNEYVRSHMMAPP